MQSRPTRFTILCLGWLFLTFQVRAQEQKEASDKGVLRSEKDLKTGNNLDVLTSFFQLAAKDLGGKEHSFQFKSTLFGIKVKADTTLLVDTVFRKHRLDRNLQFELALQTNRDFRFTGYSAGLTWGIVNNRDKKAADFRNSSLARLHQDQAEAQHEVEAAFWDDPDGGRKLSGNERREMQRRIAKGWQVYDERGIKDSIPQPLRKRYTESQVLFNETFNHLYDSLMEDIAGRGLLTASFYGKTDTMTHLFNESNLEFVYLHGRTWQSDCRAGLNYKDTLTPDNKYRVNAYANLGMNLILIKSKQSRKSLLEIKPNLEFKSTLSKQFANQENYFSFNMDVRLRITDKIWLPVIFKYDITNQNFLGFLNISVNMDAFKDALKTSN